GRPPSASGSSSGPWSTRPCGPFPVRPPRRCCAADASGVGHRLPGAGRASGRSSLLLLYRQEGQNYHPHWHCGHTTSSLTGRFATQNCLIISTTGYWQSAIIVRNETSSLRGFTATSEEATSYNGPY